MMEIIGICISAFSILVAVGIACRTSISTAKDTAKKIAALEESTQKQIEGMKELATIQLELSILQINKELRDASTLYKQTSQRSMDEAQHELLSYQFGGRFDSLNQSQDKRKELNDSQNFYANQIKELQRIQARLYALKKEIGGE